MRFFDWIRKKDGEEIKQKPKEWDYFKLQDYVNEINEALTVKLQNGIEVVITPQNVEKDPNEGMAW